MQRPFLHAAGRLFNGMKALFSFRFYGNEPIVACIFIHQGTVCIRQRRHAVFTQARGCKIICRKPHANRSPFSRPKQPFCNLIAALLHANRSPFATRKRSGVNAKEKRTWNPISSLPVSKADHAVYNDSHCLTHRALTASLGMRQSPRGLRLTLLTLGPSGRQERLNCWLKKRR